uniref:Uncharacterized protein n=1 Tax=Zea mays TaxID=4577 RepID=C4J6Z3_MAIZE|nr:unknown [Zea mays]
MFRVVRRCSSLPAHTGQMSMLTARHRKMPIAMVETRCCASAASSSTRYPDTATRLYVRMKMVTP